jgi:hypothetical protein
VRSARSQLALCERVRIGHEHARIPEEGGSDEKGDNKSGSPLPFQTQIDYGMLRSKGA